MSTLAIIYKIEKRFFIYKKFIHNLSQSDFDLLLDYIETQIMIVLRMSLDFFERRNDAIVQLAVRNLK